MKLGDMRASRGDVIESVERGGPKTGGGKFSERDFWGKE